MFAFVNGALPVRSFSATLAAKSVAPVRPSTRSVSTIRMETRRSASMPFTNAPTGTDPSVPGNVDFDPFNLSSVFNAKFMQEAEIKHGRVCMLAVVGLIFPEIFTFPFYSPPAGATTASTAMHDYFVKSGALQQLLLWISFAEVFGAFALKETLEGDREPGYFGLDPLGFAKTPEKMAEMRLKEIKNGRLAICAVGGIIHQQFVTGEPTLYNLTHFHGVPVQF